jgi:hypothetical protein
MLHWHPHATAAAEALMVTGVWLSLLGCWFAAKFECCCFNSWLFTLTWTVTLGRSQNEALTGHDIGPSFTQGVDLLLLLLPLLLLLLLLPCCCCLSLLQQPRTSSI